MAAKDIDWDDLNWAEKRAVLRADARGGWKVFRTRQTSTPAADRKVAAIFEQARQRIAKGQK